MDAVSREANVATRRSSSFAREALHRYWRLRIFYSIYLGYAVFYLTRKSFASLKPALMRECDLDIATIAGLESLLWITYGTSKLISGVLSDASPLRYFMGIGLFLTGVCNICFGLSSSLWAFALFLGLNGFFQGWGAPPCAKLLTSWYPQKERGRWWGIWNTSHNLGGAAIPLICAVLLQWWGWRVAMIVPGAAALIGGLFLINRLRDHPSTVGLSLSVEGEERGGKREKKRSFSTLFSRAVFWNQSMWILAISYFFVYIVRTGLNDWMHIYLIQQKGYTTMLAACGISCFEAGGFLGSLTAGYLSDTIFQGKREAVNILFIFLLALILLSVWMNPFDSFWWVAPAMFFLGFFIFGPQMLIGMAAAEWVDEGAAGSATGFAGLFAYLGAACAGFPLGLIQKEWGWGGFFFSMAACSLCSFLLLFSLLKRRGERSSPSPLLSPVTR